jgi:hypothetical protein
MVASTFKFCRQCPNLGLKFGVGCFFPMWYLLDTEKKKIEGRLFEEHIKNMMQIHYA